MKQIINNKTYLFLGILLAFTFIVFYPSLNCELTNWDDQKLIANNHLVRSLSLSSLKELFSDIYWYNYQPLTILSFAIEYHFFRINPKVIHLTNLLLHLLNVLLVFKFISLISNNSRSPSSVALIAAILFAIHPMRVESVTWATERKDVLYTFFYLLSLIQYVKYIKTDPNIKHPVSSIQHQASGIKSHSAIKHYLMALVFFLLSCMSKGMAVSLGLTIIIIDYLFVRKLNAKAILDKIPFFAISLFFGLIAVFATHTEQQIKHSELVSFFERIQFASYGLLFYLYKLILPVNLSAIYPYPDYLPDFLPFYYWCFPLLTLALTGAVIYSTKFSRKIMFGFGFFIATIILILQLFPTYDGIAADHYTYIAYIGLFYIIGEGYNYFMENVCLPNPPTGGDRQGKWKMLCLPAGRENVILYKILGIVIILTFSFLTYSRTKVWQNSIVLWTDVIEKYPNAKLAYNNRGLVKNNMQDYKEAIMDFNKAIELDSIYILPYYNRGNTKVKLKDYHSAIQDFTKAININPNYADAYNNRGNTKCYLKDYKRAILDFNKAIDIDPNNEKMYVNRGLAREKLNDYYGAIEDYSQTIELDPGYTEAYYNRGNAKYYLKDHSGAIHDYNKTIHLAPDHTRAYNNRGNAKMLAGDKNGACSDWEKARAVELIKKYCN
ncbi:MAG: tetratricopeptide repeat protein [Bacteroidota bacterium]